MFVQFNKKVIVILILSTAIIYCLMYLSQQELTFVNNQEDYQCYRDQSESLPSLQDSRPNPKSIFFHETSCKSAQNGKIVITAREACAVESAAKLHPNYEIYLLYVSPGIIRNEGTESDRFLQALLSYNNVKIRHIDLGKYIEDSPVEPLWTRGTLERSNYVVSHTSDLLRFLTLWKYGGIYLDLDVVVTKSLETLPPNYAGAESDSSLSASVLNFESEGVGHVLSTFCLKDFRDYLSSTGWVWPQNSPHVITSIAKNICANENVRDLFGRSCAGDFKIYPPETFYPVSSHNWTMNFEEIYARHVEVISEESYVVHMWDKFSSRTRISVGENVAYISFAKKFCPRVYHECDKYF